MTDGAPSDPPGPEPEPGPLAGIRVLELGRMFAAPFAAQFLADMGAEVIKVEAPDGEVNRGVGPVRTPQVGDQAGDGSTFLAFNRSKKTIAVDLTSPAGQDVVRRLAADSDVFIENFKAGDLARRGLDYPRLRLLNPDLIYLSISGFGQSGPYSRRPGMDTIAQAMSGFAAAVSPEGPPRPVPFAVVDFATAMYGVSAVLSALHARDVGGRGGQHVDLSLLDCAVAMSSYALQPWLLQGGPPPSSGSSSLFSPHGVYRAADGWLQVSIGTDAEFEAFCQATGAAVLIEDVRYRTRADRVERRAELQARLETLFADHPLHHWMERLGPAGVLFAPVYDFGQMQRDPHVQARDLFVTVSHGSGPAIQLIRSPVRLSATPVAEPSAPPLHDADTDSVLRERLGLDPADIQRLRAAGAIGRRNPPRGA